MSVPKCFFFPGFGGPDRSFWPDVRRDIRPKTSALGWIFVPEIREIQFWNLVRLSLRTLWIAMAQVLSPLNNAIILAAMVSKAHRRRLQMSYCCQFRALLRNRRIPSPTPTHDPSPPFPHPYPQAVAWPTLGKNYRIVQEVFSPNGVPRVFDAFSTQFRRISDAFWNVPLFPNKTGPILTHFWRISDAFLTHSCYCRRLFRKHLPWSSFPCLFGKQQGKPPKRQGFLLLAEPLKSLGKKGKPHKIARNSLKRKKARKTMAKRQGKED